MSQAKEKWDSLVLSRSYLWMVWKCHGRPRVQCYYFCLKPTVRKDTWMRKTPVTVTVFFLESSILKVTWSQICSKFLLSNYEEHWKQHFERYPTVGKFTDMDQHIKSFKTWIKSFIKTSVNMTKQKSIKVPGKRSLVQKSKGALRRRLHINRPRFTYFISFFFSQP